jgi:hypothetical protein
MSSDQHYDVAVIHLVWLPYGVEMFMSFIDSYQSYHSGLAHDLVILFNGVKNEADTKPYHKYALSRGVKYTSLNKQNGQDLEAYFEITRQLSNKYLLFLNSYTVLLANDWLAKYYDAIIAYPGVGIVGATGSYQSYYSSVYVEQPLKWEKDKPFTTQFRKYKLFVKAFFYWRLLFKPFPNPHIRTNAFMISRDLFLSCAKGELRNKLQAYIFESGRKGLTNQVLGKGYRAVIIDRDGKVYEMKDWKESHVFWFNRQENLLVGDNQTTLYDKANEKRKKELRYLAWGSKV